MQTNLQENPGFQRSSSRMVQQLSIAGLFGVVLGISIFYYQWHLSTTAQAQHKVQVTQKTTVDKPKVKEPPAVVNPPKPVSQNSTPTGSSSNQNKVASSTKTGGNTLHTSPLKATGTLKSYSYPVIRHVPTAGKRVALSFDDGPFYGMTDRYLQVLEKYQVGATFFVVGSRVNRYPQLVKDIADAGFDIGGHTYAHARLTKQPLNVIENDFQLDVNAVKNATGKTLTLFRPPYGSYNDNLLSEAQKFGETAVTWNVDPRDWEGPAPQEITNRVLSKVTDGSIILMHDGKENTLAALPAIITGLKAKGYEIVSVSELLAAGNK